MLDTFRKSQRWLTGIIITLVGIAFVFFLGLGGPLTGNQGPEAGIVVSLDDIRINTVEYARLRNRQENQLRESIGDQFDPKTAAAFIDAQTLRSIVNQAILAQSAADLGLYVGKDEIKDILRRDSSLRDEEGRFDQQAFDANVKWEFGSQAAFMEVMRRDLLQQKMIDLLVAQSAVSDSEAKAATRYQSEQVRIAYVTLDGNDLPEARQPSEEQVQAYFTANREDLQMQFDSAGDRFAVSDQVRLRHILFRVDKNADEAGKLAVRERAEQALKRLNEGEDFAELAEALSEDPNSNKRGGELGLISRGDTAPSIENVAFEIEVGRISEIVEGPEGFHLIRVDEKIAESTQPFEEAGLVLAAEKIRSETAKKIAEEISLAIASGASLEDAAREAGQTLARTGFFKRRRDGFIPQLGRASPELMATAFALTMEAPSSKQIFELGARQTLIQLLGRELPDEAALAVAEKAVAERLLYQRRNEVIQTWIDTRKEELTNANRLFVNADMVVGG